MADKPQSAEIGARDCRKKLFVRRHERPCANSRNADQFAAAAETHNSIRALRVVSEGFVTAPVRSNGRISPSYGLLVTTSLVALMVGSGVSAAHELAVLSSLGLPATLYVGSFTEWSSDPARPVETGP